MYRNESKIRNLTGPKIRNLIGNRDNRVNTRPAALDQTIALPVLIGHSARGLETDRHTLEHQGARDWVC